MVQNTPLVMTAALPLQVLVFGTTPQVRQAVLHGLLKQSPQAAAAPPPRAARQMPMLAGMGRPSAAEDGDLAAGLVRDCAMEGVRPLVADSVIEAKCMASPLGGVQQHGVAVWG